MKLTKVETEDGKKWRIDYRPTKEGDIHILQGYSGAVAHVCNQPGYHDHLEAVMIEIEEFEVSSHEVKTLEIDSSLISSIYEIPQDVTPPDPYTEEKEFELKIKPGETNVTNTKINHKCPKCDYDESKSELKPLKYMKFNNHFTGCPICGCELSVEKFEEDFNYSLIYNPIYNDILAHATITPTSKRAEFWSACETYNKVYDFLKSKGFQGDFLDFDFGPSTDGKKIIIDNNAEDFMLWAKAEGIDYREMDGYKDYIKRVRSNPETDVAETKFSTANGEVVWPSVKPSVRIALAHEDGKFPERQKEGDAGLDLFLRDCKGEPSPTGAWTIRPGHRKVFCVGIKTEFPNDMVCNIRPRSGLAVNHGIDVMAGVVDPRYRGEICVCLINHGDKSYTFEKGQRIAQMVFHKIETDHEQVEFLSDSDRGDSGFGSTGK